MQIARNAIAIVMCCVAIEALADSITVRGGDSLGGKLQSIESGAVIFESPVAGTTLHPIDQVLRLTTDGPFKCTLKDGQRVSGSFKYDEDGLYLVTAKSEKVRLELDDIEKATRTLSFPTQEIELDVAAGAYTRSGTTDNEGGMLRLQYGELTGDRGVYGRFKLYHGGDEDFPEGVRADLTIRRNIDRMWYPRISADLERDRLEGVDYRAGLYGGLGGTLFESERQRVSWSAEVGASYEDIDVPDEYPRDNFREYVWQRFYGESDDDWSPEARFGLNYEGRFGERWRFTDQLEITPMLDGDGIRGRYETAVEYGINDSLGLRLDMQFDYDSEPVLRWGDEWRTTVGAGLRVRF